MTRPAKHQVVRSVEAEVLALLRRARRATGDRARLIDPALGPLGYQVSRQVQQLIELGLVEKSEDPSDRRACVVRLSEEGETRMGTLQAERRSVYAARFDEWTVDELTVLAEQLAKYNRTLEK